MIGFSNSDPEPGVLSPPTDDLDQGADWDAAVRFVALQLTSTALHGGKKIDLGVLVPEADLLGPPRYAFREALVTLGFTPAHVDQFCSLARLAERPRDGDVPALTLKLFLEES